MNGVSRTLSLTRRRFIGSVSLAAPALILMLPDSAHGVDSRTTDARRLAKARVTPTALLSPSPTLALSEIKHGQQITADKVGRAGAAGFANIAALTDQGATTYSTTQTVRNTRFTGMVRVIGGDVTFEYCVFAFAPPRGGAALLQYNSGNDTGTVICNYCDFDAGLRGAQGEFETCGFQAGQRARLNSGTSNQSSAFLLFRCRLEGFGNLVGVHKFTSAPCQITECLLANPTTGHGTHPDGIEIYSSDNLAVQLSRIVLGPSCQSCINIAPMDNPFPSPGHPIIIQDCYIDGGGCNSPVLTRWMGQGLGSGTSIRNVMYMGNYFSDASNYGRECDFNGMDVTFDKSYALSNPTVIFWEQTNVWAPNGEGVRDPLTAPSGNVPAGRPHRPGGFISQANFFGGEVWIWNGKVVGPTTLVPAP